MLNYISLSLVEKCCINIHAHERARPFSAISMPARCQRKANTYNWQSFPVG